MSHLNALLVQGKLLGPCDQTASPGLLLLITDRRTLMEILCVCEVRCGCTWCVETCVKFHRQSSHRYSCSSCHQRADRAVPHMPLL